MYVNQSVLYDVKRSYGTNRYMYSCKAGWIYRGAARTAAPVLMVRKPNADATADVKWTEAPADPCLDSGTMRTDAPRTAYRGHLPSHQPSSEAPTVCFVPPLAQAHAVTRDSRNRARRKRKARSPQQREDERCNLILKLGEYRSASRTPDTFTRGPSPTNITNNHFQLGFMNQDADPVSSSTYWTPGPCTSWPAARSRGASRCRSERSR